MTPNLPGKMQIILRCGFLLVLARWAARLGEPSGSDFVIMSLGFIVYKYLAFVPTGVFTSVTSRGEPSVIGTVTNEAFFFFHILRCLFILFFAVVWTLELRNYHSLLTDR